MLVEIFLVELPRKISDEGKVVAGGDTVVTGGRAVFWVGCTIASSGRAVLMNAID